MSEEKYADQEFLEFLVKALVEHSDEVQTERRTDERGVLLSLRVHANDMGLVVGRQGRNANAIKLLTKIVGRKHKANIAVKIEEPQTDKA